MGLIFKQPSKEARIAMCEAAIHTNAKNRHEYIKEVENKISNLTDHEYTRVVNSGNSAILAVMSTVKGKILIPDQGGWVGFKNIAKFLGLGIIEVPTELGIINPQILEEFICEYRPGAIFITSFAGYIAEQPIKEIYEVCNNNDVVLVEDASGGIGDGKKQLANGNHAHVIIASTGSPKIVNVGNGGFISTDNDKILDNAKTILNTLKADPITCAGISAEIKNVNYALSKTIEACKFLKNEVKSVFHPDKRGLTVAIPVDKPRKVGYELIKGFKVDGGNIISICPRYERIKVEAVCIELKNLDLRCLNHENLEEIVRIINSVIF